MRRVKSSVAWVQVEISNSRFKDTLTRHFLLLRSPTGQSVKYTTYLFTWTGALRPIHYDQVGLFSLRSARLGMCHAGDEQGVVPVKEFATSAWARHMILANL